MRVREGSASECESRPNGIPIGLRTAFDPGCISMYIQSPWDAAGFGRTLDLYCDGRRFVKILLKLTELSKAGSEGVRDEPVMSPPPEI